MSIEVLLIGDDYRFAYAQMSVELAKMVWMYDMELVDPSLDWEQQVRLHFVLWKPELYVRFIERKLVTV
jgi:hypothetical protein